MKDELETTSQALQILISWLLRYLEDLKPLMQQDSDFNQSADRIEEHSLLAVLQQYQASHQSMKQSALQLSEHVTDLLKTGRQLHQQYSDLDQYDSNDAYSRGKTHRMEERESFQRLVAGMQNLQTNFEPHLFDKRSSAEKNLQALQRTFHTSEHDLNFFETIRNQRHFINLQDQTFYTLRTSSSGLLQAFETFTHSVPDSLKGSARISDYERISNRDIASRLPRLFNQLIRTASAIPPCNYSGLDSSLTSLSKPLRDITHIVTPSSIGRASDPADSREKKQQTLQSFQELVNQTDQFIALQNNTPIEINHRARQYSYSFSASSSLLSQSFLDKNNQALLRQAMILENGANSGIKLIKSLITELLTNLEQLILDQQKQQASSQQLNLGSTEAVLQQLSAMIQDLDVIQSSPEYRKTRSLSQQILHQTESLKSLISDYVASPTLVAPGKRDKPDRSSGVSDSASIALQHQPQHLEALQQDLIRNVSSLVSKDYRDQVKGVLNTLSGVSGLVVDQRINPQDNNLRLERRRQDATDQLKHLIDKPEASTRHSALKQLFNQSVDLGFQFIANQVDPNGTDDKPSAGRQLPRSIGNLFKQVVHHTASDFIDRVKEEHPESQQFFDITAKGVQTALDLLKDEDAQALIKTGQQLVENLLDPEAQNKIDVSKALSHASSLGLRLADKVINTETFKPLNQSLGLSDAIKGLQNFQKDGTLDYVTHRLLGKGPVDTPKARAEVIQKAVKDDPVVSTGDKDTGAKLKLEPKKNSISATLKSLKNFGMKVTTTVLDKVSESNPSIAPRLNTLRNVLSQIDDKGVIDRGIDLATGETTLKEQLPYIQDLQSDLVDEVSNLVSKDYRDQVKGVLNTLSGVSGLVVNRLVNPQDSNLQLEKRRQDATDQLKHLIDKPEASTRRSSLQQLFNQSVDLGFQFIADQVDPNGTDEKPSPGRRLLGATGNLFKQVVHHTASDFINRVKEEHPESQQFFDITAKGVQAALDLLNDEDTQALIETGKQLVENLINPEAQNEIDVSKALSHASSLGLRLADKVINTETFKPLNRSLGLSDAIKGLQNFQKDGTLDYVTRRLLNQGPIDTATARAEVIQKVIKDDPVISTGDKDTGAKLKLEPKKNSISATLKSLKNFGMKVTTTVLDKVSESNPSIAPRLNTLRTVLTQIDDKGVIDRGIDLATGETTLKEQLPYIQDLQSDLVDEVSHLVSKDYRDQVKGMLSTLSGVSGLVVNRLVNPQDSNLQLEKRRQDATDQLKDLIAKPESTPRKSSLNKLFNQSVDLGFQFIADQVDPNGIDEKPSPGRKWLGTAGDLFKQVVHHTASDFINRVKEEHPESKPFFEVTAKGVQEVLDILTDDDAQALIKTGKQLVENLVDPEAQNEIDVAKALNHAAGLGLKLADKAINTQTFEPLNQSLGLSDAIKGLQGLQKNGSLDYVTRRLLSEGPVDTPKARAEVIKKTIKDDPVVSTGDKDTGAKLKLEPKKNSISATLKSLKNLGMKATTTVLDKVSEFNPSMSPRLNTVKNILNSVDKSGFIDFTIDALTGQKVTAESFQGNATPPSLQPATPDFPAGPVGLPAARATDMHICSMQNPPPVSAPHVGGPLLPLPTNVLIGNLPAATIGQPCICVGPPDSVIMGSFTVLINNKPAVRMGDSTAHGGTVVFGWPTVLIG
ncbi:MAG: PAAR domain-containing protein [Endozoicomonas sp.]|uniref:PAAR domain-containing protein n=1 Tax=Endozoicomonas sp. TaxID=1892382 RepID=UPI003D9AC573